ncbi:MAG: hypothetical protein AVDCRST_MAG07-214, partial [uncultured Frankineae bacterium]
AGRPGDPSRRRLSWWRRSAAPRLSTSEVERICRRTPRSTRAAPTRRRRWRRSTWRRPGPGCREAPPWRWGTPTCPARAQEVLGFTARVRPEQGLARLRLGLAARRSGL